MLYMPAERSGQAYKLVRPFRGPYRVEKILPNGLELILISKPRAHSIRVYFVRVRRCPREIEEFDDAEVSVSGLFENPDTEGETKTNCDITDAPAIDVVEAEAAKWEIQLPIRQRKRQKPKAVITRT